jgi:hypothetical protein
MYTGDRILRRGRKNAASAVHSDIAASTQLCAITSAPQKNESGLGARRDGDMMASSKRRRGSVRQLAGPKAATSWLSVPKVLLTSAAAPKSIEFGHPATGSLLDRLER